MEQCLVGILLTLERLSKNDRFHRLEEKLRQIEWKNQWKPCTVVTTYHMHTLQITFVSEFFSSNLFNFDVFGQQQTRIQKILRKLKILKLTTEIFSSYSKYSFL
jgi:predicted NodU family carbamoyl transferase